SGLLILAFGIWMVISGIAIQDYQKNKKIKSYILTPERFQEYLNNWQLVNPIDGILTLSEQRNLPTSINSDITSYSFERVVVCDSREIANLLIANNFHFENNSAVLSIDGYPENIFDTVMQMLRRNDNLKVYVLHDASPSGVSVVNTISTNPDWFSNTSNSSVTIYDLGLLPRQVFNNSNFFTQISEDFAREAQELPSQVKQDLTEEEIKWLETGKFVELESFTPQRLLNVISQSISKSRQINIDNSSGFVDSGIISSSDSFDNCDITIFADDCFG
ncbi:MAG: MFS transporter permease, partial [Cyanobacteria bacterium J06649_11]